MSFDLLAEFGEPQRNVTSTSTKPSMQHGSKSSSSAFDGFDFSETSTPALPTHATQHQGHDLWGSMPSSAKPAFSSQPVSKDSFNAWGDLSTFDQAAQSNTQIQPLGDHFSHNKSAKTNQSSGPRQGVTRVATNDFFGNNGVFSGNQNAVSQPPSLKNPIATSSKQPPVKDDSVLFDAEDPQSEEEDDDDFGDFETVEGPASSFDESRANPPIASISSSAQPVLKRPLDLSIEKDGSRSADFPYPQAPNSPAYQERNPFAGIKIATPTGTPTQAEHPKENAESPITSWPAFEAKASTPHPYHDSTVVSRPDEDDEWGDFADMPGTPAAEFVTKKATLPVTGIEADAWRWDAVDNVTSNAPTRQVRQDNVSPPTNIPPPSILLSIFPQLFDLPSSSLFKALGSQPFSLKNRILSDPSTIDFLRAYILLATVAARLVAGRKQRWKRDHHLAQSMSISQAPAGGKGGMKLTNVDKTESNRENREASEVIRVWKDQVGRLRSAISTANQTLYDPGSHLAIPEINDAMPVRTVSSNEGGVTAPKACVICGLKRDERVAKVDVQVEDSFGEWWVEHWGHRACKNFWQEHEAQLKSR